MYNVLCVIGSLAVRHSCRVKTELLANNDAFRRVRWRRRVLCCHHVWHLLHHCICVSTWAFHLCKQMPVMQKSHNCKNKRGRSLRSRQVMKTRSMIVLLLILMTIQVLLANIKLIWKVKTVILMCTLSIYVHLIKLFKQHCSKHWCSEQKLMLVLSEWLKLHHRRSYFKKEKLIKPR